MSEEAERAEERLPATEEIAQDLIKKYSIISVYNSKVIMVKKGNIYTNDLNYFNRDLHSRVKKYDSFTNYINNVISRIKYAQSTDIEEKLCFDPWKINFKNGYYDIEKMVKGEKPFTRTQDDTETTFFYEIPYNLKFDKKYDCPKFKKALKTWLIRNPTILPEDIFEMMGYSMTTNVSLKKAFYFYGPTDSGKTTFQTILEGIIGEKNRSSISLWRMGKDQFGTHGLAFKLLNMVGDVSKKIGNIDKFLQVAGGDKYIGAEGKGKDNYEFRNAVKLWFNSNKLPDLQDNNRPEFYNRFCIVEFPRQIPADEQIPGFAEMILSDPDEVMGIIWECIYGLERLKRRVRFHPRTTTNTRHLWAYETDYFYRFKFVYCESTGDDDNWIDKIDFHKRLNMFLGQNLKKSLSPQKINQRMMIEGYEVKQLSPSQAPDRPYVFLGIHWKDLDWREDIPEELKH